jgi:hypothetical protein
MSDPVSCATTSASPSIIECDEVLISAEAEPEQNMSVAQPPAPGTVLLVERVSPGKDYSEIATECSPTLLNAALGLASALAKGLPYAVGSGFAGGLNISKCLAEEYGEGERDASIKDASAQCVEIGGIPGPVVDDTLQCIVVRPQ